MSDYNAWPSTVGTDGWSFKTRRPRATIYGPPRGSTASRGLFGSNPYTATEAQYANRQMFGFRGSGAYRKGRIGARRRIRRLRSGRMRLKTGRGGYFDNMFNFGTISQGTGHAGNLTASGMGDYTVPGIGTVDNAIVGAGFGSAGIPQFAPHESSGVFSKVEFLQNIFAPQTAGAFQNTVLPLQPGLQQTFPWLALIAPQFEEYEFLQLMFYWRPMVSDFNSGTGQTGEIVMVTQYNPADPAFTDTLRAKSYDMAMSCKASLSMNHGVECDPTKNSGAAGKYVRTGPLINEGIGSDLKQYDLGNLNVIVTGTPPEYSGQLLGELWVAYTVQLRKPKLPISTGDTILRDYFQSGNLFPVMSNPQNLLTNWPQRPIGYGSQNRINVLGEGLRMVAVAQNVIDFEYRVPTWYSGDMEIKLTILLPVLPVIQTPGAENTLSTPIFFNRFGDTESISDVITTTINTIGVGVPRSGTCQTKDRLETTLYVANTGEGFKNTFYDQLICMGHVRWLSTNNPGNRMIRFRCVQNGVNQAVSGILGYSLDCTEYNTSFNYKGGGTIAIAGADGTPITNPFAQVVPWTE